MYSVKMTKTKAIDDVGLQSCRQTVYVFAVVQRCRLCGTWFDDSSRTALQSRCLFNGVSDSQQMHMLYE